MKAELRSQLPGIVHDVSSSGATVFLEPLETVEMGNKWREMLAEEQREVARILRDLSVRVGKRASTRSRWRSTRWRRSTCCSPRSGSARRSKAKQLPHDPNEPAAPTRRGSCREPGSLYLRNARHPLLTGDVVPISVWLGEGGPTRADSRRTSAPSDFTVLLITGPNTGGKTVALKTVGLLALMAQAGLPVPADADSRLPVFDAVFADIGDEQSIEQSLSTFSSHIGNIISILNAATHRSLVLLDELAAGTDPVEGSALAKAILSQLLTIGCLTIATTHHGELKAFAHTTPGVTNGSVEFDAESLSPTYRLHIGLPGQSNALSIAERLGHAGGGARRGARGDRPRPPGRRDDDHRPAPPPRRGRGRQRDAARRRPRGRARPRPRDEGAAVAGGEPQQARRADAARRWRTSCSRRAPASARRWPTSRRPSMGLDVIQ